MNYGDRNGNVKANVVNRLSCESDQIRGLACRGLKGRQQ